jgi:hypothetical protein
MLIIWLSPLVWKSRYGNAPDVTTSPMRLQQCKHLIRCRFGIDDSRINPELGIFRGFIRLRYPGEVGEGRLAGSRMPGKPVDRRFLPERCSVRLLVEAEFLASQVVVVWWLGAQHQKFPPRMFVAMQAATSCKI